MSNRTSGQGHTLLVPQGEAPQKTVCGPGTVRATVPPQATLPSRGTASVRGPPRRDLGSSHISKWAHLGTSVHVTQYPRPMLSTAQQPWLLVETPQMWGKCSLPRHTSRQPQSNHSRRREPRAHPPRAPQASTRPPPPSTWRLCPGKEDNRGMVSASDTFEGPQL